MSAAPSDDPSPCPTTRSDPQRSAWLLSLGLPLSVAAGPLLWQLHPATVMLWVPALFLYLVAPLMDLALDTDRANPSESVIASLEADSYNRRITFALVPLLWGAFIYAPWFSQSTPLTWPGQLGLVIATGAVGGFCINIGHEIGHKQSTLERWLAKLILAPAGYTRFTIEYNVGHHRDVATPVDSASARMGESIWRFVLREMPGAWHRAWALECARLTRADWPIWSHHNQLLQGLLVSTLLWGGLCAWLAPQALLFIVPTALWANFQLTSANDIEHYGLLRLQEPDGRYERCQPRRSWNSNHRFSNWATSHLQRH